MIEFRCRCSEPFSVPDDEAGTSFQCPRCGLLVDVPTLEELPGLSDDGTTVALDVVGDDLGEGFRTPKADRYTNPRRPRPQQTIRERIPSRDRADSDDRRLSLDEFLKIGAPVDDDDGPLELKPDASKPITTARPKYDPETGELIRPLPVAQSAPLVAVPVSATPALSYERKHPGRVLTIWMPLREMFALPNMVVCAIVTLMCYVNMILLMLTPLLFLPGVFVIGLLLMTFAHFANIIDETGPTGTDEIPTPLRGGSIYDDLIRPLLQVVSAYGIAFSPVLLFNLYVELLPWQMNLALMVLTFLLVPATLLTMVTSGAANNLIPSRMFSVIGASGRHYWIVTAMGVAATVAFLFGLLWCMSTGDAVVHKLFVGPTGPPRRTMFALPGWIEVSLAPLVMFGGVYLAHVFCWQLGLLFRFHHEQFNWVLQRHDKSERTDALSQLHRLRQRELEKQAALARANLERRAAGERVTPVAAPLATPVAAPVARPARNAGGDVPVARPVE